MSDHPSTIEGALKWAKVAAECFGDEPPDMGSVALQKLANGYAALREENARLREAAQGCVDRSRPYEDESGVIVVTLGDFARLRAILHCKPAEAKGKSGEDAPNKPVHITLNPEVMIQNIRAKGNHGQWRLSRKVAADELVAFAHNWVEHNARKPTEVEARVQESTK